MNTPNGSGGNGDANGRNGNVTIPTSPGTTLSSATAATDDVVSAGLLSADRVNRTLTFDASSAFAQGLEVGDVILSTDTSAPLLVAVTSIDADGDAIVVGYRAAALNEAFSDLALDSDAPITASSSLDTSNLQNGFELTIDPTRDVGTELVPFFSGTLGGVGVELTGSLQLGLETSASLAGGTLSAASLALESVRTVSIRTTVPETVSGAFDESLPLGSVAFAPVILAADVLVVPTLTFSVAISGNGAGETSVWATRTETVTESVDFDGTSWALNRAVESSNTTSDRVQIGGPTEVTTTFTVRAELAFFGSPGPALSANLANVFSTEVDGDPRAQLVQTLALDGDLSSGTFGSAMSPSALETTNMVWTMLEPPSFEIVNVSGTELDPFIYRSDGSAALRLRASNVAFGSEPIEILWGIGDDRSLVGEISSGGTPGNLPEDPVDWIAGLDLPVVTDDTDFGVFARFTDALSSTVLETPVAFGNISLLSAPQSRLASTEPITLREGESTTVEVLLDGPAREGDIVVLIVAQIGGGPNGGDFDEFELDEFGNGTLELRFSAGETSKTTTLSATLDGIQEGFEGGQIGLSTRSPTGIDVQGPEVQDVDVVVRDPSISIDAGSSVIFGEGGDSRTFTATISAPALGGEVMEVVLEGGEITPADFGLTEVQFGFAEGETTSSITLFAIDDATSEGQETGTWRFGAGPFLPDPQFSLSVVVNDASAGGNTPPVALDQSVVIADFDSATVLPLGTDADGDPLTFRLVQMPSNGSVTDFLGPYSYSPSAPAPFTDSFTYVANDGLADSAEATVVVQVVPSDPPSEAAAVSASLPAAAFEVVASTDPIILDYDVFPALTLPVSATVLESFDSAGTLNLSAYPTVSYTGTGESTTDRFLVSVDVGDDTVTLLFELNVTDIDWPGIFVDLFPGPEDSRLEDPVLASGTFLTVARFSDTPGDAGALRIAPDTGAMGPATSLPYGGGLGPQLGSDSSSQRAYIGTNRIGFLGATDITDSVTFFEVTGSVSSQPIVASGIFALPGLDAIVFDRRVSFQDIVIEHAVPGISVSQDRLTLNNPDGERINYFPLATIDGINMIIQAEHSPDDSSPVEDAYWLADYSGASPGLIKIQDRGSLSVFQNNGLVEGGRFIAGASDDGTPLIAVFTNSSSSTVVLDSANDYTQIQISGRLSDGTIIGHALNNVDRTAALVTWSGTLGEAAIEATSVPVYDLSSFFPGVVAGDQYFFRINTAAAGTELGVFDGANFTLIDIESGPDSSNPGRPTALRDGWIAFVARTAATGSELYISDGTAANTVRVGDVGQTFSAAPSPPVYEPSSDVIAIVHTSPPLGEELFLVNLQDVIDSIP